MPQSFLRDLAALTARAAQLLVLVVAAYLGYVGAIAAIYQLAPHWSAAWLLGFVFLLVLTVLSVAVHELGHAAAAWLVGWRVHLIVIGNVGYFPRARRVGLVWTLKGGDTAGWVFATPPIGGSWEKGRALVYLGGPVANLLATSLCFEALAWPYLLHAAIPFLAGFGVVSLAMGVSNLIPLWGRGRNNDGATLLNILRGRRVSSVTADMMWLEGLRYDGAGAEKLSEEILARMETAKVEPRERATRDHLLLNLYLQRGDVERAHALLEQSDAANGGANLALTVERAFLIGIVERDAARAAALLESVPERALQSYYQYWRAWVVIHGLRGRFDLAREAAARARKLARRYRSALDGDDLALLAAVERGEAPPLHFGPQAA